MNKEIEKYLKEGDNPSSSRMMAYKLQNAFIVYLFLYLPLLCSLVALNAESLMVWTVSICYIIFGIVILGFVYAPKYLAKKLEINKTIEAIKKIGEKAL